MCGAFGLTCNSDYSSFGLRKVFSIIRGLLSDWVQLGGHKRGRKPRNAGLALLPNVPVFILAWLGWNHLHQPFSHIVTQLSTPLYSSTSSSKRLCAQKRDSEGWGQGQFSFVTEQRRISLTNWLIKLLGVWGALSLQVALAGIGYCV